MPLHQGQPVVSAGAPVGTSPAVTIMIHGRNASAQNILSLVPRLDRPNMTYLAPSAANNVWYPHTFLSDTTKNEPYLSSSLQTLAELIEDVASRGIARDRIILMGFSQGACLACEFAVRNARRYGGVVAFSGALIGAPGTTWHYPGSLDGTPVFMGCSDVDAHIPKDRVDESAEVLARMGAAVTKRIYAGMGHAINDDEIEAAQAIIDGTLA